MSAVADATRKLQGRYIEGLPAKWRVVMEALTQLRAGNHDAEASLRRVAHQVRGSAASFGLVHIDRVALRLEQAKDPRALELAAEDFIRALRGAYDGESKPTTRVLLIDDDPGVGFVIRALLVDELLSVTQVTSAALAMQELDASEWSIIFVDLVLPDADGRTLLTRIRSLPLHRETPVVVISAKSGSLARNECLIYGIDAYIEKPIDPETFAVQVGALLARTRGADAVAAEDALTGLPNRLGFRRRFDLFSATQRRQMTLAVIDIDHFAQFNEAHGRPAGDRLLVQVAKCLRDSIRDIDLLARWGAGEFIVAFPGLDAFGAVAPLDRVSKTLAERSPDDLGHPVRVLAGISEIAPDEQLDYGLLRADQLLFQVKRRDASSWYAHTFESAGEDRPKILVAEDDPMMASILLHDLADDFDITYVADGEAAIAAASKQVFELVLLDYQMPKCDGVEVIRALRSRPTYADKPILLLTAIGSDAAVEAAFDAGADDYINKPYRRRSLLARLSRHLGRAPANITTPDHTDLSEAVQGGVETEVTALFCDICGFTGIAASLAPRAVLELLNTYFPVIASVVHRHGGTLEKFIGDAVLAVWGVPRSTPNDVVRALTAAVEIQQAIRELGTTTSLALEVHIGLNSGLVVAANVGCDRLSQFAIVGDTTNLASRISDLAGPGEIVVSDGTIAALASSDAGLEQFEFAEAQRADIKGRDEQITFRRLRWE